MANLEIKLIETNGNSTKEIVFKDNNASDSDISVIKKLIGAENVKEAAMGKARREAVPYKGNPWDAPGASVLRQIRSQPITPVLLEATAMAGQLDMLLHPFDEIDIPVCKNGQDTTATIVCAHAAPNWARFVFKDCWDNSVMNLRNGTQSGYCQSEGRIHVLGGIWPCIHPTWQAIIKPRKFCELVNGERVQYADPLWLPSMLDIFGESIGNVETDGRQLLIFKNEKNRVKKSANGKETAYWLNSTNDGGAFMGVTDAGHSTAMPASWIGGFAPGFDIGVEKPATPDPEKN